MFQSMAIISPKNRAFNSKTFANLPGKEAMHNNAGLRAGGTPR